MPETGLEGAASEVSSKINDLDAAIHKMEEGLAEAKAARAEILQTFLSFKNWAGTEIYRQQ